MAGRAARALLLTAAAAAAAATATAAAAAAATEADTADAAVLREDAAVDTPVSPLSPEPSQETEESGSPQRFIGAAIDALTGNAFSLDPVEMHGGFFSQEPEPLSDAAVEKLPIDDEKFDFIIVGGGAAGCAAADILSQSGKKVLLLERGMQRTRFTAPNAMSARGAGIGLADATISQPVGTVQGVRTFSGAVMGGGSAVNLGIVIGETEDYFKEMSRQFPGYNIQYDRLKRAYEYVGWKVARAMPVLPPFGNAYSDALTATGYRYWGGGSYPQPSLFVQPGYQWVGYSLFDAGNNFQRNASDALLEKTPNLLIKTRHTARKVTFIDTPQGKTANCVVYRPTKYQDIRPIGDLWSLFPSSAADWAPWVGSFLEPTSVLTAAGVDKPKSNYRRVCLANPGKGRIVLSAGAVHTPLILYRSGIGPAIQLSLLKVPQVLENPAVGSAFSDRVFLSIPGFLKHYTDSIPLINPVRSLRRLAANEDAGSQNVTKLRLLSRPSYEPILSQEQLEKAITPEVREAVEKILNQSMPVEVITIDEDDDPSFRTGFDPPVLLPDNLMFPGPLHYLAPALQPRVCQFMGLRYMGPHCKGPRINERNLGCSLVTMEELSGDRLAEGFIYASRYMFPTAFRKDPILDAMTEILQGCSNYRAPFGLVLLKPLCVIAQPVIKCLRKAVAPFYFTSEPKSRGSIRLKPNGEVVVDPQYLVDEQDLFDAIRGAATLVDQINGESYKGIIQEKGPKSCPLAILNGLLDILLSLASTTSPFLTHSSNFAEIQRYLQDLIPPESRRLRRLMVVNDAYRMKPAVYEDEEGNEFEDYSPFVEHDVDEAKMEKLGIKRRLEAVGFDFAAYRAHVEGTDEAAKDPSLHLGAIGRRLDAELEKVLGSEKMDELKKTADSIKSEELLKAAPNDPTLQQAIEDCKKPCTQKAVEDHTCAKLDVCCTTYGNSKCIRLPGQPTLADQQIKDPYSNADAADSGGAVKKEEFLAPFFGLHTIAAEKSASQQWAATYPPRLPSSQNPKALAKFALSYMTSIGHTYGSAPMGKVVDDKFRVMGLNGLSIVDASVLPQLTRMNPVYTIMSLGRYAGETMLQEHA